MSDGAEVIASPRMIADLRRECGTWRARCRHDEEKARRLRSLLAAADREVGNLKRVLKAFEEREACTPTRRPDIVIPRKP